MTKICLIGNSHLAVLKLGWPHIEADFPEMILDFYASAGDSLQLTVSGNRLEPETDSVRKRLAYTSEKSGHIEPDYDAYVVCGLMLSSIRAMRAYQAKTAELRLAGIRPVMAWEAIQEAVYLSLRPLLFADILEKIRHITAAPIFLIGTPLPALERHPNMAKFGEPMKAALASTYSEACERIAREFRAEFLHQPEETVGPLNITTRREFYLLSSENVQNEKAQHTHMNVAYGAIVLKDVLNHVRAASEG